MQNIKLNLEPYFDDFKKDKNYYKVLFKPGYPVQARELTTLQSMLQHQIERFGQHIFKEGSVVIPGQVGYDLQYNAVLVQASIQGISVENIRETLVDKEIRGFTSNVKAKVINTISAEESDKATITLYVKYTSSGNVVDNAQLTKFINNEILVDSNDNPVAITTTQNASAYVGSAAYITAGVYFIRGFFVEVPEQKIILDQYNNFPSYKVGLNINESIITSEEDSTLYDNAVGTTNFTAPGADRLKIEATLSKQELNYNSDSSFIELLRLEDGNLIEIKENSIYDELEANLARRTFDESGNYSLSNFDVRVRETYNNGENNGLYKLNDVLPDGRTILNRTPTNDEENSIDGRDYYTVEVSPGKAYVKGFEINNLSKKYLTVDKPRKTLSANNQGIIANFGSYFLVDTSSISSSILPGATILFKKNTTTIGKARALGLISGGKLFVADLTMYTTIVTNSATSLQAGDFIFTSDGSQAVLDSNASGTSVILRQVKGNISTNSSFTNSRNSQSYTISSATTYKIEDITSITNSGATFECDLSLEAVTISGSSFTVASNSLTGVGTNFTNELSSYMKLQIGTSTVTISSLTSSAVTLTGTVADGTYYNVKKLIPKLKVNSPRFYQTVLSQSVKSTNDFTYYKIITETKTVSNGAFNISTSLNYTISANDILITSSSGAVSYTTDVKSAISVDVFPTGVSNGSTVTVTYKVRVNNPSVKTKEPNTYKFLIVDKDKDASNTIYGIRKSDKEISLKFPDVYKIHTIHEALSSNASNTDMFDKVVINDNSSISIGDIISYENIKAKVIDISGTTLYVLYLTADKFEQKTYTGGLKVDIISSIQMAGKYITSATNGKYKDITTNYALIKNDSGEFYNISKLQRLDGKPTPTNKFIVIFDYLNHTNSSNDLYSASSFSYDDIPYDKIPTTSDGIPYTDIVDFRYETTPSSGTGGSLTSPYRETASALDFYSLTRTISSFVFPGEVISLDYDYYLGRVDKIFLDENSNLIVNKGSDSLNPQPAEDVSGSLLLATIKIPPYMKNINDVTIELVNNKRYTMRDIGSLEKRIETVETLTSLNLLEVNTNTLNIVDDEGNNRFKTGFVADNFKSTSVADLNNPSYSASIDTTNGLVRPYPYVNNVSFQYLTSSGTKNSNNLITVPFEEVPYITQQYSSRVENLQPFEVIHWNGEILLSPSKDVWYDTIKTPGQPQSIDLSEPIRFLFDNSGAAGEQWGAWTTTGSSRTGGGTNIFQERTGVNNTFSTVTTDIQVGDTIDSITSETFIRPRIVDLVGEKLKANTFFHFFVDDRINNSIIFPKHITGMTSRTGTFVIGETVTLRPAVVPAVQGLNFITATVIQSPSGNYSANSTYLSIDNIITVDGSNINPYSIGSSFVVIGNTSGARGDVTLTSPRVKSDSTGIVEAFLVIPPETYETGQTIFKLCDQESGTSIYGLSDSSATTVYNTQGTEVQLTSNVLSLETAQITSTPIRGTQTVFIPDPPPPPPPAGGDPIAQSFFVGDAGGIFLTSIDLYFQTKDSSVPVSVEIRTMENGTLTNTVVPYSVISVDAADVKISSDASQATRFTFRSPVYLNQDTYYAFIVRSQSKLYKMWISRLSETDITTGLLIDKQPYIGSLFKSQNMNTWTPDQFEDVKFVINRAKFKTGITYTCKLGNSPVPVVNLNQDSFKFTEDSSVIEVYHPNHGMNSTQNYVAISGVLSNVAETTLNTAITSGTQSGTITLASINGDSWTTISSNTVSESNPGYVLIGTEIIKYTNVASNVLTIPSDGRGQLGTTKQTHAVGTTVRCYNLNGIPLTEINKTHKLTSVIDLDHYQISAIATANNNLIAGGNTATASRNIQYEELYPNLNLLTLSGTDVRLGFESVSGNSLYAPETSFTPISEEPVQNKEYNVLNVSRLVISNQNKDQYFTSNSHSLQFNIGMSTTVDNLSPVLDVVGSSAITVSNRISKKVLNNEIDVSAELTPVSGNYSSYITKKITLENTSTSIKVLLDAIRFRGLNGVYSDIKVFAKINSDSNLGDFTSMNYTEIPAVSYPLSNSVNDYKAFDFELKNLPEFKEFAIKVCMISNDQTNVPKIRNFRAIALAV